MLCGCGCFVGLIVDIPNKRGCVWGRLYRVGGQISPSWIFSWHGTCRTSFPVVESALLCTCTTRGGCTPDLIPSAWKDGLQPPRPRPLSPVSRPSRLRVSYFTLSFTLRTSVCLCVCVSVGKWDVCDVYIHACTLVGLLACSAYFSRYAIDCFGASTYCGSIRVCMCNVCILRYCIVPYRSSSVRGNCGSGTLFWFGVWSLLGRGGVEVLGMRLELRGEKSEVREMGREAG